ncbi:hypothetical protein BDQ12DRAFT_720180 [Crucibulum laeve]|uniref:FAS1 domain-containing protein n=1 Tax=Crucibulum laeve TaxID=68775 RepID=A0A5C3MBB1_9AGAR|nr:hypothetical protein BDQ12DRAFT_720180 [Crucibulum laeve]
MASKNDEYSPQVNAQPTLADLLTIEQSASIFYSYARELELSRMFADVMMNATLLVPTNKAVMALARKPHQSPETSDEGIEITQEEFDNLSKSNVERWVSAHIIPVSPISLLSNKPHPTLLSGKSITFVPISKHDGKGEEWSRVKFEDDVRIVGMKQAANGVFYLIDGTVTTDSD